MKLKIPTHLLIAFCLSLPAAQAADLREGIVSYWPLDSFSADLTTTPDLVTGNHLLLQNFFDATALVPGKVGKAVELDGDLSQRHLFYTVPEGEDRGLPVSQKPTYTIAFWVKSKGTGQSDRRMFSESSSLNTDPLVNLGTHNGGADDTVDVFIRNNGTQVNHVHSPTAALDDAWHHVTWTYEGGTGRLYIDGKEDYTTPFAQGTTAMDTTSIGAIVRASSATPVQYFFTGLIDDVAVWERALTAAEVQDLVTNGIQTPVPVFAPVILVQPQGATNLLAGDSITLSAQAVGTRPLTYEWRRNNAPIAGANAPSLTLSNITQADTGEYILVARNSANSATSQVATLTFGLPVAPNLTNDMVAYWPLNEVQGTKTPDLVNGYDMELENMTAADLASGKWGQALSFDNARKTLLRRINRPGEDLPIYNHPEFSVSIWVNGAGAQTDRRVFSEGSTKTTQPLFNIGTHNGGADGTVDSYIRTDAGATSGDHWHSTGTAFDDTWHHIAYVQREVGGAPQAVLYIDGVADDVTLGPVRPLTLDTTTIGGILRASASAWFTGLIDDVALWKRALSGEEVQKLFNEGTPTPPSRLQPLAITKFSPDLPAVAQGDSVILRWDVSKDATAILIEPAIGDVSAITTAGAGQTNLTVDSTTTFTLTIKRGTEQLSAKTTLTVIDGVGSNWTLLDNFDRYAVGPLAATGFWQDLRGDFAQVQDRGGNRVMTIRSTDSAAILNLRSLTVAENQKRTLFFRFIPAGSPTAALQHIVGLIDKNVRTYGDATVAAGIGPMVYPLFDTAMGTWHLGTINGVGGVVEYFDALETNVVYSVWVDVENRRLDDPANPNDMFSVYIQKEGDATRTALFTDYMSNLDITAVDPVLGGASPDLDKLFVAGNNTAESALFDDFYLSDSGFNSTVPRAFGFTTPVGGGGTGEEKVGISRSANQVEITWTTGTLESATSVAGPWSAVAGAAAPSYRVTPEGSQRFYRVRQ